MKIVDWRNVYLCKTCTSFNKERCIVFFEQKTQYLSKSQSPSFLMGILTFLLKCDFNICICIDACNYLCPDWILWLNIYTVNFNIFKVSKLLDLSDFTDFIYIYISNEYSVTYVEIRWVIRITGYIIFQNKMCFL